MINYRPCFSTIIHRRPNVQTRCSFRRHVLPKSDFSNDVSILKIEMVPPTRHDAAQNNICKTITYVCQIRNCSTFIFWIVARQLLQILKDYPERGQLMNCLCSTFQFFYTENHVSRMASMEHSRQKNLARRVYRLQSFLPSLYSICDPSNSVKNVHYLGSFFLSCLCLFFLF